MTADRRTVELGHQAPESPALAQASQEHRRVTFAVDRADPWSEDARSTLS
jgi:hypothetical protein